MDRRDRNNLLGSWYSSFDQEKMVAVLEATDDEGDQIEIEIACRYEVCGTCYGKGSHVNPSIDSHGISPEEFAEDRDFEESYFRGDYDVICSECDGNRVVPVPDEDKLTQQARDALDEMERSRAERVSEARYGY